MNGPDSFHNRFNSIGDEGGEPVDLAETSSSADNSDQETEVVPEIKKPLLSPEEMDQQLEKLKIIVFHAQNKPTYKEKIEDQPNIEIEKGKWLEWFSSLRAEIEKSSLLETVQDIDRLAGISPNPNIGENIIALLARSLTFQDQNIIRAFNMVYRKAGSVYQLDDNDTFFTDAAVELLRDYWLESAYVFPVLKKEASESNWCWRFYFTIIAQQILARDGDLPQEWTEQLSELIDDKMLTNDDMEAIGAGLAMHVDSLFAAPNPSFSPDYWSNSLYSSIEDQRKIYKGYLALKQLPEQVLALTGIDLNKYINPNRYEANFDCANLYEYKRYRQLGETRIDFRTPYVINRYLERKNETDEAAEKVRLNLEANGDLV